MMYEFFVDYMEPDVKARLTQKIITVVDEHDHVLMVYPLFHTAAKPYVSKGLWVETKTTGNKTVLNLMMHSKEVDENVTIFEVHITKEEGNG